MSWNAFSLTEFLRMGRKIVAICADIGASGDFRLHDHRISRPVETFDPYEVGEPKRSTPSTARSTQSALRPAAHGLRHVCPRSGAHGRGQFLVRISECRAWSLNDLLQGNPGDAPAQPGFRFVPSTPRWLRRAVRPSPTTGGFEERHDRTSARPFAVWGSTGAGRLCRSLPLFGAPAPSAPFAGNVVDPVLNSRSITTYSGPEYARGRRMAREARRCSTTPPTRSATTRSTKFCTTAAE